MRHCCWTPLWGDHIFIDSRKINLCAPQKCMYTTINRASGWLGRLTQPHSHDSSSRPFLFSHISCLLSIKDMTLVLMLSWTPFRLSILKTFFSPILIALLWGHYNPYILSFLHAPPSHTDAHTHTHKYILAKPLLLISSSSLPSFLSLAEQRGQPYKYKCPWSTDWLTVHDQVTPLVCQMPRNYVLNLHHCAFKMNRRKQFLLLHQGCLWAPLKI